MKLRIFGSRNFFRFKSYRNFLFSPLNEGLKLFQIIYKKFLMNGSIHKDFGEKLNRTLTSWTIFSEFIFLIRFLHSSCSLFKRLCLFFSLFYNCIIHVKIICFFIFIHSPNYVFQISPKMVSLYHCMGIAQTQTRKLNITYWGLGDGIINTFFKKYIWPKK